ncbi:MAG TPA: hypothetical protein VJN67_16480 [Stellaceae bacterium]|nr:hypothetical protein [Stellaceae bacterium]
MTTIYVARSSKLSKWASDVGLSKHIFKLGCTDEDPKSLVVAGWASETDWQLVKKQVVDGLTEAEVVERVARKEKLIDPNIYPRIRGAIGLFKVVPAHVENHMLVRRALAGEAERIEFKLKPADFADYLIANAVR